jgi:hypothetical protein
MANAIEARNAMQNGKTDIAIQITALRVQG